jgi:hypothetical protein
MSGLEDRSLRMGWESLRRYFYRYGARYPNAGKGFSAGGAGLCADKKVGRLPHMAQSALASRIP